MKRKSPRQAKRGTSKPAVGGPRLSDCTPASARAAQFIDVRIQELLDSGPGRWRGEVLARVRALFLRTGGEAIIEEWKWGVPVWSCAGGGIICTGEAYKATVKLTFAKGAFLPDPARLFNSSLEGKVRRAIDFREGESIDERALAGLLLAAVHSSTY